MKLNVSLSPLCLALALFSGTAYADGVIVAGTMHKTGSLAVGKESVSGENAAAVGDKAKASGYKAVALGYDSAASGLSAMANPKLRHCGRWRLAFGPMPREQMM